MLNSYLNLLMSKSHLTCKEAEAAMFDLLDEPDPSLSAAFLAVLKFRGETPAEVAGFATALQKKAVPVCLPYPVLDIVGTGGDLAHTVNISTGAAILAAACGIPVAKHGNRSVSSHSGSADVLEALNIDIEAQPEQLMHYLEGAGMAFMFAPLYHPSLKKLIGIRKGLRFPTIFNILGPLINPARAEYALIGAANVTTLELMSQVVLQLNHHKRALLFHGCGLDELTTLGTVIAYDIHNGKRERLEIDPRSLGFTPCSLKDLQGGDARCNASILEETFAGRLGAVADALTFNAGAAVWIFGGAATLIDGIQVAQKALQEGKALKVLEKCRTLSKKERIQ